MTAQLYTDGSVIDSFGGWACLIILPNEPSRTASGCVFNTTSSCMELRAIIEGLRRVSHAHEVEIYTDSKTIRDAFSNNLFWIWKSDNWKPNGKLLKNAAMWQTLDRLLRHRKFNFNWVPSHSGFPGNVEVDKLALAAAMLARKEADRIEKRVLHQN